MEIEVGNKYMCIKDVVMQESGKIAYYADKVYKSEEIECITDEQGNKDHYWLEEDDTENYFKPYVEKPLYWFVGNEENGKMLLREMEQLTGTCSNDEKESESGENLFYYDRLNDSIALTHNNGVIAEMIKEKGEEVTLPKRWRAEVGGKYWVIGVDGTLYEFIETRAKLSDDLYAVGNYFKTKEECAKGAEEFKKLLKSLHDED